MKRLIPLAALAAALLAPAPASAVTCDFMDVDSFPAVHGGSAHGGLSCPTAKKVGNAIQRGHARQQKSPTRLRANGMRFRCGYRFYSEGDGQLMRATCRRTTRPKQRVVLKLSA